MKVLQVLQPHALDLIKKDELVASKELRDAITKIVGDEFSHTLSHRWAIYIHGKILTRLAATALKLETAKNAEDLKTFQATINSLTELLSNPDSEFEKAETDLDSEIASRLDPWLGLLDIKLEIDSKLKSIRSERVRDIGEVIEEIISNSMRHGKANEVHLRVRDLGDKNIEIIAVDNAPIEPPMNQIRFGLGTRIFNLASDSRWSITRVNSTTVFKLVMAIE
jgi:two-component sensor histidine kinase